MMNIIDSVRIIYGNVVRWLTVPQTAPEMNRRNFINVQIDAIGVGLASTAAPFLPVFLTRLGASTLAISALTFMPAVTGLLLAIPLGQFLQSRRSVVPWFSLARLGVLSSYALTGLITILLPQGLSVYGILAIWALATIPQTVLNITFSVVMNSVAGPAGRFELMTHRWSLLGATNLITALVAGRILDSESLPFPTNYQVMFIALSIGGLISYYFSSKIYLPDRIPTVSPTRLTARQWLGQYFHQILNEKPFVSFVVRRFVFLTGIALAAPLLPIYYVRVLDASDSWIAYITIVTNLTLIFGYWFWSQQSRRHGSRRVLLAATLGVSLFPILVGITQQIWPLLIYAAINGIFQAGQSLVMFDELMKRIPEEYSASFVAAGQGLQYMSSIAAPLMAAWLGDSLGFGPALIISGVVGLMGFVLFLVENREVRAREQAV